MNGHLFLMQLDQQRYALRLQAVVRVVRMVEIQPVPRAPSSMLGVVNVQGEVLPVLDLRRCFGHRIRAVEPQDVLVIAQSGMRRVALSADAVSGVVEAAQEVVAAESEVLRHSELLEGVVKLPDGMVMVCDIERIVACGQLVDAAPGQPAGGWLEPAAVPVLREPDAEAAARQRVLRERAKKLSQEPVLDDGARRLEIVEFTLSDEGYAIESGFIREVYPLKELTPLPCTPAFVLGIVNLRGKILSVIDMRKFFQLPEKGLSDLNKVIILEGSKMEFGILADAIVGVRTIDARELQPSLPTLTEIRADYLRGITGDRLVVLDAEKMLTDRRIVVHEEV